jgi:DNA-binding MarR family transcriptional regulator
VVQVERAQLLDAIIEGQREVLRAAHAASTPSWLELQLTMAQLKALFVLASGALSVSAVGEALGTGKAAASLLVDRLVQLGLAERTEDPVDRRRTLVHLTPEAERSVSQLREGGRERFRDWLDRLSDDDVAALAQGMRALVLAIERDGAQTPRKVVHESSRLERSVNPASGVWAGADRA